jgi:hypothetical protein
MQRWPSLILPDDLRRLVEQFDGIHPWANAETGRAYIGIAPIDEWELARIKMFGATSDLALLDANYIAISYHADGNAFIVLDASAGRYFLMDSAGPDNSTQIGQTVGDVLDWLWVHRVLPEVTAGATTL